MHFQSPYGQAPVRPQRHCSAGFFSEVVGSHHIAASPTLLVKSPGTDPVPVEYVDIPVHPRYITLSHRELPFDHRSQIAAIYGPPTAMLLVLFTRRSSLGDRIFFHGCTKGMELTTKCTYNIHIISLCTIFIYNESSYIYLKWSELKKAVMLLHEAMSTLAEVVYSYTNDHANLLGCLSCKKVIRLFFTINPRNSCSLD